MRVYARSFCGIFNLGGTTMKFISYPAIIICLLFGASLAAAQNQDPATGEILQDASLADRAPGFHAEVEPTSPNAIAPLTEYEFSFVVANTSNDSYYQRWIGIVDLFLPSLNYVVDTSRVSEPDGLHDGVWEFAYSQSFGRQQLTWRNLGMWRIFYGDIREGEQLEFSFVAMTDDVPSGVFNWRATADSGEIDTGYFVIGEGDDDADDDDDDDDTHPLNDDADDDTASPDDDTEYAGNDDAGTDDDSWNHDDDQFGQLDDDDDNEDSDSGDEDITGASSGCGC